MTDLKDWIEKLRDQKTATCPADYEERCELAHALSVLEKERDEARRIAGLGCDANGYGAHAPASQGAYTFCELCGETLTKAKLSERLSQANARAQAAETELSALKALWKWLGDQVDLELSWGDDAEEEGSWQVHRVSGSRSDLEWELIASGPTPLEAVQSARSLLSEAKGRG